MITRLIVLLSSLLLSEYAISDVAPEALKRSEGTLLNYGFHEIRINNNDFSREISVGDIKISGGVVSNSEISVSRAIKGARAEIGNVIPDKVTIKNSTIKNSVNLNKTVLVGNAGVRLGD